MQRRIVPAAFRFRGLVDFELLASSDLPPARGARLVAPGVDVHASSASDIALDGTRLAVAVGHPRFPAEFAHAQGDAHRWLDLWQRKGSDAPATVKGTYAVALVDVRSHRALLATDRFATQPMCYAFDGRALGFASRADAVPMRAEPGIDEQALYDYLYFHVIPAPRTAWRGVSRLRGGHCVAIEGGKASQHRYWLPTFDETSKASISDLGERFRTLVREAVARDASGDAVGAYLSGGTDSSTIAGMIGEVRGAPPRTFSIGFDVAGYDELGYARVTAQHFRTQHAEYYLTPRDVIDSIARVAARYDQPFGNSSALAAYHCAKLARESGVDTLLAGDGGDELFGGNTRYALQRLFSTYGYLPAWLRSGVLEPALLDASSVERYALTRKVASFVRQARVPMPERMETYNLLRRIGIADVLEPGFIETVDTGDPERQQRQVYDEVESASLVNRMLAYDWKYTLADNDLPKVIETAALAGADVRFPLLSDELVDFSLELRPTLKVRGLKLRYFFKHALRGFLPDATIAKKKHGFGMPFGAWLVRDRALRDFAVASLATLEDRGIVRPEFMRTLVGARLAEHAGYYGEMVWILLMLATWFGVHEKAPVAEAMDPGD
ncbi:MAG TPA: asparagine synthase C-terminal domain-containing protein [Casimicrobiaceae bacterium]|nr:asparagine synthase C-terminal domain-containing protein [Casimicrobiaceae bacterium]